jgi:hypothetical protein
MAAIRRRVLAAAAGSVGETRWASAEATPAPITSVASAIAHAAVTLMAASLVLNPPKTGARPILPNSETMNQDEAESATGRGKSSAQASFSNTGAGEPHVSAFRFGWEPLRLSIPRDRRYLEGVRESLELD